MRIGQVTDTLTALYNNEKTRRRSVFLRGKSGVGKSSAVHEAVSRLGVACYDMRLSTADPTNFGLLMPEEGELVRQKPDFIAYMEQHPEGGILFLDELTSAPPAVQAPAYQVVLDHACNGFRMPESWMVVGAGNEQSDRGVTYPIAAPLLNRMTLIEVETVLDDVIEHGAQHGLDPRVMAFLKSRADLLHRFSADDYGNQFPTPRGWFAISDKLSLEVPAAQRAELLKGDVGTEAAASFEGFLRVWETMPDLDHIEEDPENAPVPEKLDVRYCVAMGLSVRVTKKNFATILKYLERLPQELHTLVGVLAYHRDNAIAQSPAFAQWAEKNREAVKRV